MMVNFLVLNCPGRLKISVLGRMFGLMLGSETGSAPVWYSVRGPQVEALMLRVSTLLFNFTSPLLTSGRGGLSLIPTVEWGQQ